MFNWLKKLASPPARAINVEVPDSGALREHVANKDRGNAHLAQGELTAAFDCYRQAISLCPEYAEAHNNLGIVCHQRRQLDDAETAFNRAIALDPNLANAYCNLGSLLQEQGRFDEAVASFRQAVTLTPHSGPLLKRLGDLLQAQGRLDEAVPCYEDSLALDPSLLEGHNNLATALRKLGRVDEALERFEKAALLAPGFFAAHYNRGIIFRDLGKLEEAAACFRRVLLANPNYVDAYDNLGAICHALDQFDEASRCLEKAVSLRPDSADLHCTLGLVQRKQGRLDVAAVSLQKAIALDSQAAHAHKNLGLVLHDQGRLAEAEACYQTALSLDPAMSEARFNLAVLFLTRGELPRGWSQYEYRFSPKVGIAKRDFHYPEWCGEALDDKTLLIWGEQGVGDEISFANLFPEMIMSAKRCLIECSPKLLPLFTRSFPKAEVVPKQDPPHPATSGAIDYQIAAGGLARWLRPLPDQFPPHHGYLLPDAARVDHWRTRLAALGHEPKIGIAWRSSNLSGVRSLYCTRLAQWGPIFAVPGLHFISLQYDECTAELDEARRRFEVPLHAFGEVDLFNDLLDAAALTKALDLVISAPTAVSILAAAVGVPTWMMTYGVPWQTLGTDHFPWFPAMRLYARRWDQPWEAAIADIARNLKIVAGNAAGESRDPCAIVGGGPS